MEKVELVHAGISNWFVEKNKYLAMVNCVTEWYLAVEKETEKAVLVRIWDEHKGQTYESSHWTMWMPKSVCGWLNK